MRATVGACAMVVLVATACADAPRAAIDERFVADMIPHHELGIELVEIAQRRADDVRLRRLVFEMDAYHHDELHELEEQRASWGLEPSSEFDGSLEPVVLDELVTSTGPLHDVRWLTAMIEHHEGAVAIAGRQVRLGSHAGLVDLADRIAEVQQRELAAMRALRDELCTESPVAICP